MRFRVLVGTTLAAVAVTATAVSVASLAPGPGSDTPGGAKEAPRATATYEPGSLRPFEPAPTGIPSAPPEASLGGEALAAIHYSWINASGERIQSSEPDPRDLTTVDRVSIESGLLVASTVEPLTVEASYFSSFGEDGAPTDVIGRFECLTSVEVCSARVTPSGLLVAIDVPEDARALVIQAIYPASTNVDGGPNTVSWGVRFDG